MGCLRAGTRAPGDGRTGTGARTGKERRTGAAQRARQDVLLARMRERIDGMPNPGGSDPAASHPHELRPVGRQLFDLP